MEPERAKAIVRAYFHRLLNEQDLSVYDEFLASDYRDHDAPPDVLPGPDGTKAFVAGFLRDYPDLRVEIKDLVAEGNRVAARVRWRAMHRDTGQPYHKLAIVLLRLNGAGQLTERWSGYAPHPH